MGKLSLGTAQFGLTYGISNKKGKVKFQEVKNEKMVILVFGVGSNIKWTNQNQTR